MLLAEDFKWLVSVFLLDFHAVVSTACTFDMERDLAAVRLALDASTSFLEADDALQGEPLLIKLGEPNRSLWGDYRSWDPVCTAEMDPLIESWCLSHRGRL
jgi:hypothetical protein